MREQLSQRETLLSNTKSQSSDSPNSTESLSYHHSASDFHSIYLSNIIYQKLFIKYYLSNILELDRNVSRWELRNSEHEH